MTPQRRTTARLEIKPAGMQKRLIALFNEIDKNAKTRESFIRNPTRHITNTVMKKNLPPQQISEANRLLFSLLSNDKMVKWLKSYPVPRGSVKMNKRQFSMDFAKEVALLGDKNIIASIVSNASQGFGIPGLGDIAYQCVCNETPTRYDCACTPVSKYPVVAGLNPELLRAVTENLIARAKELSDKGMLVNLELAIH